MGAAARLTRSTTRFFAQGNYSARKEQVHSKQKKLRDGVLFKMADELNVQPIADLAILERLSRQVVDQLDPLPPKVLKDGDDRNLIKVVETFDCLCVEYINVMIRRGISCIFSS